MDDTPNVRAGLLGDGRCGALANLSACPGRIARPPSHTLDPRGHADRRDWDLDYLQRRRRSGAQGRMRQCHGRLLRGGRPHDRLLPHVWLVAAGDRLRPSKARAILRAILGRKGLDFSAAAGPPQIEQSRRFWGVPKFDLVQIHNLLAWKAHLQTLFQMKAAGAVRYVGITTSEGRRHDLLEQIMRNEPIDFVQFSYNVVDREAEARLLPLASERGIAVIVNRPFRQGALTHRLKNEPLPEWAAELGASSWAQLILKFILSQPAVTVAIPATTRVDHVRENLSAAAGPMPDLAMRERISAYVQAL